jgi:uroporphyrin-III C-methyltransferase / precorrin-2 dehydrogenase / sirohydrochlorin ferrochelatase
MRHFPIFLDLAGKPILVVGATPAAATKAEQLARAGALVRRVDSFDGLGDAVLVVCADETQGEVVATVARAARVPVNVVDRPAFCDFFWPSIVERDPITIAISTSGASPVLARHLRTRIELAIPAAFGRLAEFAGRLRARIARAIPDLAARRRFWDQALNGEAAFRAMAGDEAGALREIDRALLGAGKSAGGIAFIAIPDDPEQLTLRALRHLQDADAVIHPVGIDPRLLDLARRDAERVVDPSLDGLIARVKAGQRLVRFGGDERERAALTAEGIEAVSPLPAPLRESPVKSKISAS